MSRDSRQLNAGDRHVIDERWRRNATLKQKPDSPSDTHTIINELVLQSHLRDTECVQTLEMQTSDTVEQMTGRHCNGQAGMKQWASKQRLGGIAATSERASLRHTQAAISGNPCAECVSSNVSYPGSECPTLARSGRSDSLSIMNTCTVLLNVVLVSFMVLELPPSTIFKVLIKEKRCIIIQTIPSSTFGLL